MDREENPDTTDIWYDNVKPIPDFEFDSSKAGPVNIDSSFSRFDVFKKIFSDEILDMLVVSTNTYWKKLCESNRPSTWNRRMLNFRKTNKSEMCKFLGLCLLQAQIRAPTIRHSFSNEYLCYHPIFPYTMSGRRFEQLLRCLSSYESPDADKYSKQKKLGKTSGLVNLVIKNFQDSYIPTEKLTVHKK